MTAIDNSQSGRVSARDYPVWDPLVRLIHWSLALAIALNATIIDEEATAHLWIGYAAVGLVITRLVWGLIGTRHARFSAFPPDPRAAIAHLGAILRREPTVHLSHNPLGALMAYNLWVTVIALGITGYMMGTPTFFGVEWVEEIHEAAFVWLISSIALHIAGVAFDTWRSGVPLVRSMLDGRKRIPTGSRIE